ncbi:hypothetical protein [Streptomyces scopuliridis]|uniref:hypothetical protein n=1 Tax=Streptomyces scopuliridis TaxID=452529 RepID=UPI00368A4CEA
MERAPLPVTNSDYNVCVRMHVPWDLPALCIPYDPDDLLARLRGGESAVDLTAPTW